MFQKLVNHNDDIKQLVQRGYAVGFDSNYLIIRDIPYLDQDLKLQWAAFVSKLKFVDNEKVEQVDHQIYFSGTVPYGLNGKPIPNLGGGVFKLPLSDNCSDVVVQRSFSSKPFKGRVFRNFKDLFDKVDNYVTIICGPAIEMHNATPLTFRISENIEADPIFKFHDTLTSLAGISDLSAKFNEDIIAIIGVGGTGSYVLDFIVKTPVREIRIFDNDPFYVHNSYRAPGKVDESEFGRKKVDVYNSRYSNFRHGLSAEPKLIDSSCTMELNGVTFAFVCVDKGTSRANIFDLLISQKIPFINVGMGLNRKHDALSGMLRTTYYSSEHAQIVRGKRLAEESDQKEDLYRSNIQISELNALNACLAVIKFKQLRGFYFEESPIYDLLFDISDLKIVGEFNINED